jgi:hypothetical protein
VIAHDRREFRIRDPDTFVLVWCHQLPADGIGSLLDAAKGFTDHIPQPVLAQFGTVRPSPPAPPFTGQALVARPEEEGR